MKKALALLVMILSVGSAHSLADASPITLDGDTKITAGEPWQLRVTVNAGAAGENVQALLFNGFRTFQTQLTLGTGGVAVWQIQQGQITQAGTSLVVVQYGDDRVQQALRVFPEAPTAVDMVTTANAIPAYGDGTATILLLPRDTFGNAPLDSRRFLLDVQYPDGTTTNEPFTYNNGLGRYTLNSQGMQGRVRLSLDDDALTAALELMQIPSVPAVVALSITPDCVLDDGRDVITLSAVVTDAHRAPVSDGTLVVFDWDEGMGYGHTLDGRAPCVYLLRHNQVYIATEHGRLQHNP
jgi:hypothetical protein